MKKEENVRKIIREIFKESIFSSVEKNSIGGIDFRGDDNLRASVTIEDVFIDADGKTKPFRHMEVYKINSPSDSNNIFKHIERQGFGTKMLNDLISYCKAHKIEYIGSKSLNDKSFGLFNKFEKSNILIPIEYGLHKKPILWKII